MDIKEFRQKYPQYQDMPDQALADSFYTKYYSDMPKEKFMQSFLGQSEKPAAPAPEDKNPGIFSRLNEDLVKRGVNIADELNNGSESLGESLKRAPGRAFRATGQAAGLISDAFSEPIKSIYKTVVPDKVQNAISGAITSTVNDPLYKPFVQGVSQKLDKVEKSDPMTWKNLGAAANIGAVALGSKPAQKAAIATEEAAAGAKNLAAKALEKSPEALDKELKTTIKEGVQKAIRPGVEGKRTFSQSEGYFKKAQTAVENIVLNKNSLKLTDEAGEAVEGLPKNLKQFSQATEQTKQTIFKEYDAMQKAAGKAGATVDVRSAIPELEVITNNKALQDFSPKIVAYAKSKIDAVNKVRLGSDKLMSSKQAIGGVYTAQEAQDSIAVLNKSLEAFYNAPSYDTASKAYVDAIIANHLRKNLDSVIEKTTEAGYQNLKNAYGSLKAIEKEVNHRAIVDGRKNGKGLIDFTDVFSGSAAVHGILTLNPAVVGEAAAAKGIARLYKYLNDPNRVVKSMFEKTETLLKKKGMINDRPLTDVIKGVEKGTQKSIAKEAVKNELENDIGTAVPLAAKTIKEEN